jgi:hypothetical protein
MQQKRIMMEEWARQYGGCEVPPPPFPKLNPNTHEPVAENA